MSKGGTCKFEFCNIELIKEYFNTCSEYIGLVPKPFNPIPVKQLFGCNQSNWEDVYKQWGIIQFWVAVIVAILVMLILIIGYGSAGVGAGIQNLLQQVIIGYIVAHLGWFGVVKRKGCCCCCILCCEGAQILLVWGILLVIYGVLAVLNGLSNAGLCDLCILIGIFQIFYAIPLIYMGVACVRLWQAAGANVVPGAVEVDGPDGQKIGA